LKKPAVFIDRDGTINEQMGYVNHISRFVLLPRAAEAIRLLNRNGYLAIVVSNQSGVARGYFPGDLVHEVHRHMVELLKREGASLDDILFCPHHPGGSVPEYRVDCLCRKPNTGLIDQACDRFDIDLAGSYVVGDRYSDMELAERANLRGILVKTGYGLGEIAYVLPHRPLKPVLVEDLLSAVVRILQIS
jgi:D-glycero-D-manno-heptose 1,7-bisphosphate phosphatase